MALGTFFMNNTTAEAAANLPSPIEVQMAIARGWGQAFQWMGFGLFLCGLGLCMIGFAYWIKTFDARNKMEGKKHANTTAQVVLGAKEVLEQDN